MTRPTFRFLWVIVTCACVLVLAGCGGSNSEPDPLDAARTYEKSWSERDPVAVCESLTGQARRVVVSELGGEGGAQTCEALIHQAMTKLGPKELGEVSEIADLLDAVSTAGDRSDVRLSPKSHLEMRKVGGAW